MRIVEMFYSIQGEGTKAGDAALFIRFSGCNRKCPWCDTDHSVYTEFSVREILEWVDSRHPQAMVVLTGGEPFIQPEGQMTALLEGLVDRDRFVAVETNGTVYRKEWVDMIDWVTVSPKPPHYDVNIPATEICELKYVVDPQLLLSDIPTPGEFHGRIYLQPLSQNQESTAKAVEWILKYPHHFSLSVQIHKYLNLK